MHTYQITVCYHGGAFAGWQRQAGFDSVQERLEEAFRILLGEPVVVHGAGRTDAGVHALRQCAHVRLPRAFEPAALVRALNGNLPDAVRVLAVEPRPGTFHARFSALGKRYVYRFVVAPVRPPFGAGLHHWVRQPLDLVAMRAAAAYLRGRHDFAAFATNPGYTRRRGTVRTIHHLHLIRRPHGVDLAVQGDGFLYNMVRSIAGTLRDVGLGRLRPTEVAAILASCDRRRAGMNCEAGGLYLLRVLYRRRGGGRQPDANAQGRVLDSEPSAPTPSEDE